jgi:hypothetical protein
MKVPLKDAAATQMYGYAQGMGRPTLIAPGRVRPVSLSSLFMFNPRGTDARANDQR